MQPDQKIYLLGIESSGLTSSVCLGEKDQLRGLIKLNIKNIHSRRMATMVEQVLDHTGHELGEVAAIVLSAGPGSFTGLRIGFSLAKGLSFARQIPIIEIPTLDIWAWQQGESRLPVLAMIDAHRGEIFCAGYYWEDRHLKRKGEYALLQLSRLSERLTEPTLIVGGDALNLREAIEEAAGEHAVFPVPFQDQPTAAALLALGYQEFLAGRFVPADAAEPHYMRDFKGVM